MRLTRGFTTSGASDAASPTSAAPADHDPALVSERERLTERFALMQSELGGLFYEMAIRDHVKMDVLIEKAAALQRVDTELAQVEHLLHQDGGAIGGQCTSCGASYARGSAFCSGCGGTLDQA